MEPAQPPSRRKQLKRQQQVLGRKGMPSVRQASQDDLLPFCDPTDGVVCADIDKYGLLKAGAAGISLSDTFPFFRVRPFGSWEGTSKSTVDLLNDIVEDSTAGKLSTGLDLSVFDEQLNSTTDATSTLASAALNLGPKSSLKVAGDKTDVKGSFVWNTLKPVFNVVNGLPIGLQTVKDGRN